MDLAVNVFVVAVIKKTNNTSVFHPIEEREQRSAQYTDKDAVDLYRYIDCNGQKEGKATAAAQSGKKMQATIITTTKQPK